MSDTTLLATPPFGAFKAIVWKELRENFKWAVAGFLGMTAWLTYKAHFLSEQFRFGNYPFDGNSYAIFESTVVGAALAGLLLGLAQTVTENRGDKWGFLTHRPVHRSTLFWAKVASGILIYLAVVGVPFAGAMVWMAWPGNLAAPFDWRVALPAVADLLCGLVFYFAGLLTGMRDARWYASRSLGIGAAFACAVMETTSYEFWSAVLVCLGGILVMGAAARGTFVSGGQYSAQATGSRTAIGLSVGLGITVVGIVALSIPMNLILQRPRETRTTDYRMTTDGTIAETVYENNQPIELRDLQGRPLEQYKSPATRNQAMTLDVLRATLSFAYPLPGGWAQRYRSTRAMFTQLVQGNRGFGLGPTRWYFLHRLGLIAAYSSESGRLVGWMGPDGFSDGTTVPRAFPGRLANLQGFLDSQTPLLVFEDAVYRFDLNERRVEKAFQASPGETILAAESSDEDAGALATYGERARFEAISTSRRVLVQLRDGTRLLETPQNGKPKNFYAMQVVRPMRAAGMPIFVWYAASGFGWRLGGGAVQEQQITEFTPEGTIAHQYKIAGKRSDADPPWREHLAESTVIPLGGQLLLAIKNPEAVSLLTGLQRIVGLAIPLLLSLLSAAAAFSRGKAYALAPGQQRLWTYLAILLGPLAFLTMLALLEWPAREQCPGCGRMRVVTREHCEHCSQPFAAPTMDGTEIFET